MTIPVNQLSSQEIPVAILTLAFFIELFIHMTKPLTFFKLSEFPLFENFSVIYPKAYDAEFSL
jgi:hypothetical protein